MTRRLATAGAVTAALAFAPGAATQVVYRSGADAVVIDVLVTDDGKPVTTLEKSDFELRDDGIVQSILDFDYGTLPLDVTLTLDISGSMTTEKRAAVERAVRQVSGALEPDDRGAVVTFAGRAALATPLRHPPIAVALTAAGRGTSLFDALLLSLPAAQVPGRRRLNVFMTDGDDTSSCFDAATVLETAKHAHTMMSFVVVRGDGARADGEVLDSFQTIARVTGGEVIRIDEDASLSRAFLAAITNFRLSYVLHYVPVGVPMSGWHDVTVTVASGDYEVRARRGYQAPEGRQGPPSPAG
jgi:VWFA-related protein